MVSESNHIQALIDKLNTLPPERVAEVEDIVDFLRQREQERQLTQAATKSAEAIFQQVWKNPEDAVYDKL